MHHRSAADDGDTYGEANHRIDRLID
jgi:hypothetical protein